MGHAVTALAPTIADTHAMNWNAQVDEVVFRFGSYELFTARRLLLKGGHIVKVGSRALDLLVALVGSAGRVIAKDELMSAVWSNVVVEDTNLRVHIAALRRVLGDNGIESRYIVHVARRGYVFVMPTSYTTRAIVRSEGSLRR
jgi:DNA-binding winged helix-turn-helix (wHTH) protein